MTENNGDKKWRLTREKILMFSGLAIIASQIIVEIAYPQPFELMVQFIIAGLALCGVSISRWNDKL